MNKSQSKLILEAMKKMISSEVSKQIQSMKVEIYRQVLQEVKRQMPSQSKNPSGVRSLYESPKPQGHNKKVYSTNPLLNELLTQTELNMQLLEGQEQVITDKQGKQLNVTAHDSEGRPVNFDNPAVAAVLESMNKRYDDFIDPEPERKKPTPKQPVQPARQQARPSGADKYLSSMSSINDDVSNIRIDPFNEEW